MATTDEILMIFQMLQANYHYALKDMTAAQVSDLQVLWCELLRDIDGELLRAAALQHVATSKWFPTVAELREAAANIVNPDHHMTAMEAWGEVVAQIRSVGSYGRPQFSNPLIHKMVSDMGWNNLCTSEMPGADRARFIDGYKALVVRQTHETMELPQVTEVKQRLRLLAKRKRIDAPMRSGKSDSK